MSAISLDRVKVVQYGLGPRGIESQRVWSGAAGSALAQTALGFPVYDTHGNNAGMVSISGTVAHERTYSPWGEVVSSNGSPPQQGYCANLGHRSDPEGALTYMRARYYEPTTGRFLTEDPARDGANWYAYCANNPTNRSDRTGKSWDIISGILSQALPLLQQFGLRGLIGAAAQVGVQAAGKLFEVVGLALMNVSVDLSLTAQRLSAGPHWMSKLAGYVLGRVSAAALGLGMTLRRLGALASAFGDDIIEREFRDFRRLGPDDFPPPGLN